MNYIQKPTFVKAMQYNGDNEEAILKFLPDARYLRRTPGLWYVVTDTCLETLSDDEFREKYYTIGELENWLIGVNEALSGYAFNSPDQAQQEGFCAVKPHLPREMGWFARENGEGKNPFTYGTKLYKEWENGYNG